MPSPAAAAAAAARPLVRTAANTLRPYRLSPAPPTLAPQRRHSGGGHGPEINHTVRESYGPAFWLLFAAVPTFTIFYRLSRSDENGETPSLTRWLQKYKVRQQEIVDQNAVYTKAVRQASEDKIVLLSATKQDVDYQPRDADMWDRYSRKNMTPSSVINMDAAKDVYRRKYRAEEERQVKLAAERQQRLVQE